MIENGAKADVTEERFGCTPLHWAAALGITEICQILCKAGAQPHRKDKNGCDAIFYANQSKNTGCIEYLQSIRKYDLNIRTPLIRNSKQSNRETSNGQKPNSNPTRDIVEPFEESEIGRASCRERVC